MMDGKTLCVICAWRSTCNKKFLMDGATTTKCADYTRDVTLRETISKHEEVKESPDNAVAEPGVKNS